MTTTIEPGTNQLAVPQQLDPSVFAPRMVVSLDALAEGLRELDRFKREIMQEGVDFGTIPGTPKPTLLKPGAEKLALAFALAPIFEHANRIEDWERGFFHYEERCVLTSRRTGDVVASANGSANSREPRYRWRDAKPACPRCGRDLRRSRDRDEWYCWQKVGGCGANVPSAEVGSPGRIENPEPWELCNTILKMAQKRALVAAVLIGTGGSGIWTQDIEDMPSVAGEHPRVEVIDGQATVVDAPAKPVRTVAREKPRAKPSDIVTSADEPLWKRWVTVLAEAQGLGLRVETITLPIGRTHLANAGIAVNEQIKARKAELAAADAERRAPRPIPEQPAAEEDEREAEF